MTDSRPEKMRAYNQHPIIDSERWSAYRHRPDDIVITTSYKAGTTWTQTIVANLLYQDGQFPAPVSAMSPWLDMGLPPLDEVAAGLEAQEGRRFIKTHLPLDGIPFYDTMKYVYVGRDGRDVFMSMWNHHSNYSEDLTALAHEICGALGRDWPSDYQDIHDMWRDWISKSWFDWEDSGYPYWSHLHHVQSWWNHRDLPNIHFIHFADLLADPEAEIRRLAAYLGIEINDAMMPGILERISFGAMRKGFQNIMPEADGLWRGGGQTFMNKGTNGRWQGVLTDHELAQYEEAIARTLSPECARWLEHGGPV